VEIYIIYGITDCPACLRACADLMENDIEYVFVETDFSPAFRTRIKNKWEWKTFPIIIKSDLEGDNLIGGYTELSNLLGFIDPSLE
jgi:glutaredoxin